MILLIDAIGEWEYISVAAYLVDKDQPDGPMENRTYYLAKAPKRALVVCKNNLRLGNLHRRIVDARLGWDTGIPGFCRIPTERQTKITIYRIVSNAPENTLTRILNRAPSDPNPFHV